MAESYEVTLYPVSLLKTVERTGEVVSEEALTWMLFPEEVSAALEEIVAPYIDDGDDPESKVERILMTIERTCRYQVKRFPWAIVFLREEYPIAGHLMNIRSSLDVRFISYSLMEQKTFDHDKFGPPPVSVIYFFTKKALLKTAESGFPLICKIVDWLRGAADDGCTVVIGDSLDPQWISDLEKSNAELFFKAIKK